MKIMRPYTTDDVMPKTKTGPETMNIFAPKPVIKPSLLNSIAGETMEFAKPVIGTSVPAPACFAMLSYQPRAVRVAESKMRLTETAALASLSSRPMDRYKLHSACPKVHISPPKKNANAQFFNFGEGGEACFTRLLYSCLETFFTRNAPFEKFLGVIFCGKLFFIRFQ